MEWIAAGLGILEGISGLFGASKKEKLEKQQTQLEFESNMEDIRRRKLEQEEVIGATKALSETAGVRHTGGSTAQGYLDVMTSEFKKEIEFATMFAKRSRALGMRGARYNRQSNMISSLAGGIRGVAGSGLFD